MRGDPAEQGKASMVVGPVLALRPGVGIAATLIKEGSVDHINRQFIVAGQAAKQQFDRRCTKDRADLFHGSERRHASQHAGEAGQNDSGIQPAPGQCLRQGADHIGQTARFDQGIHLGSYMKNTHGHQTLNRGEGRREGEPAPSLAEGVRKPGQASAG